LRRLLPLFVLLALGAGCLPAGQGSTGGGGGSSYIVFGRVVWIETGSAPSPAATVRIGAASETTDPIDGSFQLTVPSGSTSASVTYAASSTAPPIVRTFGFPGIGQNTDLGDLFIGPEQATVSGRAVDSTSGSPLGSAIVRIAGLSAATGSDGRFSIPGVAYSSSALAVFLGLQGSAERTGYFTQFFSPPGAAIAGQVEVGDVALTPEGATTPPPLPFNLTVLCRPISVGAGSRIEVRQNGSLIRQGVADSTGRAVFWLPGGTYRVSAVQGAQTGTEDAALSSAHEQVQIQIDLS
jgi:hypothetical protein